jgi:hypothetical protein
VYRSSASLLRSSGAGRRHGGGAGALFSANAVPSRSNEGPAPQRWSRRPQYTPVRDLRQVAQHLAACNLRPARLGSTYDTVGRELTFLWQLVVQVLLSRSTLTGATGPRSDFPKWGGALRSATYSSEQVAGLARFTLPLFLPVTPDCVVAGCFCNVGGCQEVLGLSAADVEHNYMLGRVCSDAGHDIINGKPTGKFPFGSGR